MVGSQEWVEASEENLKLVWSVLFSVTSSEQLGDHTERLHCRFQVLIKKKLIMLYISLGCY